MGLRITPVPFRSSSLSIPPSPHSPLSPLTSAFSRPTPQPTKTISPLPSAPATKNDSTSSITPAPAVPLPWLWQCCVCHRQYSLGVTRRCLDDGHYFCSGQPQTSANTRRAQGKSKKSRKSRRGQSCASEFDYAGWQAYGDWRRREIAPRQPLPSKFEGRFNISVHKNCSNDCNYPSECRWSKAGGVPATKEAITTENLTTIIEEDASPAPPSFEELLGLTPPDMIEDDVANDIAPLSPPSPKRQDTSFWSSIFSTSTSRRNNKQDGEVTVTKVADFPVQDVIMGDDALGFSMDDALLLADADYFKRQTLPEVDTISPMVLAFPSPFQLSPPAKRTSTDAQPLAPSPLRIAKNSSTITLDILSQNDMQCGLGISMSDDEPQKMTQRADGSVKNGDMFDTVDEY